VRLGVVDVACGDSDAAVFELVVRVGLTRAEAMLGQVSATLRELVSGG
jgi:hypothetical protein